MGHPGATQTAAPLIHVIFDRRLRLLLIGTTSSRTQKTANHFQATIGPENLFRRLAAKARLRSFNPSEKPCFRVKILRHMILCFNHAVDDLQQLAHFGREIAHRYCRT